MLPRQRPRPRRISRLVLPHANRMRRSAEFRAVLASGRRARRGCLVVHQLAPRLPVGGGPVAPTVGLVVGRAVGGSVERHQVSRRLRAQLRSRLDGLAPSSATVVRALPGSASVDSAELGRDLDAAFRRLAAS